MTVLSGVTGPTPFGESVALGSPEIALFLAFQRIPEMRHVFAEPKRRLHEVVAGVNVAIVLHRDPTATDFRENAVAGFAAQSALKALFEQSDRNVAHVVA